MGAMTAWTSTRNHATTFIGMDQREFMDDPAPPNTNPKNRASKPDAPTPTKVSKRFPGAVALTGIAARTMPTAQKHA